MQKSQCWYDRQFEQFPLPNRVKCDTMCPVVHLCSLCLIQQRECIRNTVSAFRTVKWMVIYGKTFVKNLSRTCKI